jgi:hypothetical protein
LIGNIANHIEQREKFIILISLLISLVTLAFGLSVLLNPRVEIQWKTESEVDTLGFLIYRKNLPDNEDFKQITPEIIFAEGSSVNGSTYSFTDKDVESGQTYIYELFEVQLNNEKTMIDKLEIKVKYQGLIEVAVSIALILFAFMVFHKNNHK